MKIWHISDTHTFHEQLKIPDNIDLVIHSGDCSNYKDPYKNEQEVRTFLSWYYKLPIKHKIYVAGNHDTSIERKLVTKFDIESLNIKYLEHSFINIEDLVIFGSPYTPTHGDWSFMKSRETINRVWDQVLDTTKIDILVTHGPPKTILDLSYNRNNELEFCGDNSLLKFVKKHKPKYHLFGHIHNFMDIKNFGTRTINDEDTPTIFSNGSCVEDGKFDKGLINNGNIFEI